MTLSRQSIENLLDLVEIKLSAMQVLDREDARELRHLETCRRELLVLQTEMTGGRDRRAGTAGNVVALHH
jgi:hypothetical protein